MGNLNRGASRRSLPVLLAGACALFSGCGGSSGTAAGPPDTYSVGGTVSGLGTGTQLALLDNGQDALMVSASGAFTFSTRLAAGSRYTVAVQRQPRGFSCAVSNGSGVVGAAPVASVRVACGASVFTVGGVVSGLDGTGLVLANGSTVVAVPANAGSFSLPGSFASGASYDVIVTAHPPGHRCSITQGSGVVGTANVSNIMVACVPGAESVLHAFPDASADGATPYGTLLRGSDGALYGLTFSGGANGLGTAFRIAADGTETVLHAFGAGSDGANPHGSLLQASDGNFYGVTAFGGDYGHGVVFELTPAGDESVLHSFGSGAGAQDPYGTLLQASDGNFYGTSLHGGAHGLGAVFMIRPDGSELVLHSFGAGNDGQTPAGSLVLGSDGNLYGMSTAGGGFGYGVIFVMTLQGAETVLHSFGSGGDGASPTGTPILASGGSFYALTSAGGSNGRGAAIRFSSDGSETVLVSFGAGNDGASPGGDLLQASDGNFYALASAGGSNGAGAVLQISPAGAESVLYSFGGGADGQAPFGSLIEGPDAALYGMTSGARAGGTAFRID
ncbi:MAG TPA: choice-of-anchor tandem repeat GloVer-containing protein [Steroidobacteraceae bacterium]|jgi:uncharacterized repeat protein (TIGR03803 family)